jgi:hypothetical protein
MGYQPISEYGIVGNDDRGGHFAVRPTDSYDVQRRYLGKMPSSDRCFERDRGNGGRLLSPAR